MAVLTTGILRRLQGDGRGVYGPALGVHPCAQVDVFRPLHGVHDHLTSGPQPRGGVLELQEGGVHDHDEVRTVYLALGAYP